MNEQNEQKIKDFEKLLREKTGAGMLACRCAARDAAKNNNFDEVAAITRIRDFESRCMVTRSYK